MCVSPYIYIYIYKDTIFLRMIYFWVNSYTFTYIYYLNLCKYGNAFSVSLYQLFYQSHLISIYLSIYQPSNPVTAYINDRFVYVECYYCFSSSLVSRLISAFTVNMTDVCHSAKETVQLP